MSNPNNSAAIIIKISKLSPVAINVVTDSIAAGITDVPCCAPSARTVTKTTVSGTPELFARLAQAFHSAAVARGFNVPWTEGGFDNNDARAVEGLMDWHDKFVAAAKAR